MFELQRIEDVSELIAITKSDSGISGPLLAETHIELGKRIAKYMSFPKDDTTVVALLRGGIFFAQGIYFELGCSFQLFDPKNEGFKRPKTKNIILVDSVINTGNTIEQIYEPDMKVACCVINEKAVEKFDNNLYTIRTSNNSFIGSDIKIQQGNYGPDTTMRLFNAI